MAPKNFIGLFLLSTFALLNASQVLDIEYESGNLFYFAYGTNMLEKRLHQFLPKAKFFGPAVLKMHRLDFVTEVSWWNGAVATITKDPGESVWGVLWLIKAEDKGKLDAVEGVYLGWFHEENVMVYSSYGHEIPAIVYVQNHNPRKQSPWKKPSPDRLPSATYIKVLVLGAVQAGLPLEYIRRLYNLPNNGRKASQEILEKLGSPFTSNSKKIDIRVFV